jgi:hypothetical protein
VSRVYWEKWKKERSTEFDFSAAVDQMLVNEPLNLDYYFYEGKFVPNFVIRYEHLTDDIETLEKKFNLKLIENMPRTKNKIRTSGLAVLKAKMKIKNHRNRAGVGPKPTISLGKW